MSKNKADEPGRGDLVLGTDHRYAWTGGHPEFPDAVREANADATQPPEPARPENVGVPLDLLTAEGQTKFIPSPRRQRWREIQRFDERVAEVDAHQRELSQELQRTMD